MPIFVYQRSRDGDPDHGWDEWVSFGARPEFFFTKFSRWPLEAGLDHTRSGAGLYEGWLRKFTIAPQIGAGRKFFSRPVLRAFLTYATGRTGSAASWAECRSRTGRTASRTASRPRPGGEEIMLIAGDIGGTKTDLAIYSSEAGPHAPLAQTAGSAAPTIPACRRWSWSFSPR